MVEEFGITPSLFALFKNDLKYSIELYEYFKHVVNPDILYKSTYMIEKYKPEFFDFSTIYSETDNPAEDCPVETVLTWDAEGVKFHNLYMWLANHPAYLSYFLIKYPGTFLHLTPKSSRADIILTLYYLPFEINIANQILKMVKPITMFELLLTAAKSGDKTIWTYIEKFGVPYLFLNEFMDINTLLSSYDKVIGELNVVGKKYFPELY